MDTDFEKGELVQKRSVKQLKTKPKASPAGSFENQEKNTTLQAEMVEKGKRQSKLTPREKIEKILRRVVLAIMIGIKRNTNGGKIYPFIG